MYEAPFYSSFLHQARLPSVLLKLALSPEQVEHWFSVFSSSASHSADHELSVYLVIRNSELFISIPLIKKYKVLKTIPLCKYIFFYLLSYVCIGFSIFQVVNACQNHQ